MSAQKCKNKSLPSLHKSQLEIPAAVTCTHTRVVQENDSPKSLNYGENAFIFIFYVSGNKRGKTDVRIKGERSEENMKEAVSWVIKGVMHVQ